MVNIRVKGKYLVLIAALILLMGYVAYAATPGWLYSRAQAMESKGDSRAAKIYYEKLFKYFPYSKDTGKALFFTAQRDIQNHLHGGEPSLVYIFPGSTGSSGNVANASNIHESINKLLLVRERFPQSPWAEHALLELGKAYYVVGEHDKAS